MLTKQIAKQTNKQINTFNLNHFLALYSTFIQLTLMSVFFILIQQMNYLVHELNVCIKSSEWTLLHVKSADDDCLSADQNEEKSSSNSQKRKKRRHRWDHLRERYSIFITCSQCEKKVWEPELCYVFCEFNIPKKKERKERRWNVIS